MGYSAAILSAARRHPALAKPLVRGACSFTAWRGARPHWLLMQLKDVLGIRLRWRLHIDGFIVEADPLDGVGAKIRREGLTEPETRALFAELLRPGMTVLDIGAYIGQFSLVASRAMRAEGRVLCFEPTPPVFEQLRRNVSANSCGNVEAVHSAVSDHEGSARFYVHIGSNDQSSLHPLVEGDQIAYDVPVTTVDAIVSRFALSAVDLVKIDVEGYELAVLRGARDTIARLQPKLIIEVSRHQRTVGYTGGAIRDLLADMNYHCFRLEDDSRSPYQPHDDEINAQVSHFNILALPRPLH